MLKVNVLGYAIGVRSSRKLDRLLERDFAFRNLAANHHRDFHTSSKFRKDLRRPADDHRGSRGHRSRDDADGRRRGGRVRGGSADRGQAPDAVPGRRGGVDDRADVDPSGPELLGGAARSGCRRVVPARRRHSGAGLGRLILSAVIP